MENTKENKILALSLSFFFNYVTEVDLLSLPKRENEKLFLLGCKLHGGDLVSLFSNIPTAAEDKYM